MTTPFAASGAGLAAFVVTDISRDGMLTGPDTVGLAGVLARTPVPVIASGGVGTLDHLVEGIRDGHATAVLAASIFHFGTYRIGEAKARLAACGIPVRR